MVMVTAMRSKKLLSFCCGWGMRIAMLNAGLWSVFNWQFVLSYLPAEPISMEHIWQCSSPPTGPDCEHLCVIGVGFDQPIVRTYWLNYGSSAGMLP